MPTSKRFEMARMSWVKVLAPWPYAFRGSATRAEAERRCYSADCGRTKGVFRRCPPNGAGNVEDLPHRRFGDHGFDRAVADKTAVVGAMTRSANSGTRLRSCRIETTAGPSPRSGDDPARSS